MGDTITALTSRLSDPAYFRRESHQRYELKMNNGKRYQITKHRNSHISVERLNPYQNILSSVKTFFAEMFGMTNRIKIRNILEKRPDLLYGAHQIQEPLGAPGTSVEGAVSNGSLSSATDDDFRTDENTPLIGSSIDGGYEATQDNHITNSTTQAVIEHSGSSADITTGTDHSKAASVSAQKPDDTEAERSAKNALKNRTTGFKADSDYRTAEKETAAKKIQAGLRGFKVRRDAAARKKGNTNAYGRFMMTNSGNTDHNGDSLVYYFDKAGISPAVRRPQKKAALLHRAEGYGGIKELTAKDGQFVELADSNQTGFDKHSRELREVARHLAPYPSCCPTIQLDGQTVIARSGGSQLQTLLKHKKQTPEIKRFKQACTDLTQMLKRNIIPLDIKAENMTIPFDEDNKKLIGQARFIDTDDTIVPTIKWEPSRCNVSPEMTTQALSAGVRAGDTKTAKANAVYAMLLLLTEATDETLRNQPQLAEKDATSDRKLPHEITRANAQNYKHYLSWINKHVKQEYRESVKMFLINPAQSSTPPDLAEVINWDS